MNTLHRHRPVLRRAADDDLRDTGETLDPVILDIDLAADPGAALTLIWAVQQVPALELVITTNDPEGKWSRLAAYLTVLAGRPITVAIGDGCDLDMGWDCDGLTPDWLPPQRVPLLPILDWTVRKRPRWVTLGPMTTLSTVLQRAPQFARQLCITHYCGARSPRVRAHRNMHIDSRAAQHVLEVAADVTLIDSSAIENPMLRVDPDTAAFHTLSAPEGPEWNLVVRRMFERWFAWHETVGLDSLVVLATAVGTPVTTLAAQRMCIDDDGAIQICHDGQSVRRAASLKPSNLRDLAARPSPRNGDESGSASPANARQLLSAVKSSEEQPVHGPACL